MAEPKKSKDIVELKVSWVDFEEAPVHSANQFVSQFMDEGMFIVSFGMVTPPFLVGTDEERKKQAEALGFVPVRTLTRLAITPQRLQELIQVLQTNLAKYEERHRILPES